MQNAAGSSRFSFFAALVALALLWTGCDAFSNDEDSSSSGTVFLSGQILNGNTQNPVPNAIVRVLPFDLVFEADEEGRYDIDVEVDSTMDLGIRATANGYSESGFTVLGLAGREIEVPTISIVPFVDEERTSGAASNILLLEQSASSIGVKESGSKEVADITFQLADSSGNPVILDKKTLVNFSFGVHPGGGEFLNPPAAETDNNGVATVHLSSGTTAGVVQIIAETEVDGRTIRSHPVAVSIHGGLPDQSHFSLGPVVRNFPGLNQYGLTNTMTVIVGDKWSNPVRPGTSVSFSSSHGVIEGSTLTNSQGQGSVTLLSANPLPPDGVAHIRATSADDQNSLVESITPVVFSGITIAQISPSGGAQIGQTYTLTLTDQNNNPLVEGTSISVAVAGEAVDVVGATSVTLDDTQFIGGINYEHIRRGPGWTEFSFTIVTDIDPTVDPPPVPRVDALSIKISSPNGNLDIVLGAGGSEPMVPTDGASKMRMSDGSYKIMAAGRRQL